jgi:hypothetical protein
LGSDGGQSGQRIIRHLIPSRPTLPSTRANPKEADMSIPTILGQPDDSDERGDVPGWVLITLMTAGLVIIIWGLAGPALSGVFEQAIERVTSF